MLNEFSKTFEKSITNISYLMHLIVITYLIIPNELLTLAKKLSIYLPILPFTHHDYLLYYQVLCTLAVITFVVSHFGLIPKETTVLSVIYSSCSIYTCILFIVVQENYLKFSKDSLEWVATLFKLAAQSKNLVINFSVLSIIIAHFLGLLLMLLSISGCLNDLKKLPLSLFFQKYF